MKKPNEWIISRTVTVNLYINEKQWGVNATNVYCMNNTMEGQPICIFKWPPFMVAILFMLQKIDKWTRDSAKKLNSIQFT